LYKKYFQFKRVLLAGLCILFSGVITAQGTDKAVEKLPVSGTIKDAVSNKGLVGIRVTVEGFSAPFQTKAATSLSMYHLIMLKLLSAVMDTKQRIYR
jgi:hypothetical protein